MKQFLPSVLFVCFIAFGINATAHYNKFIGHYASTVFKSEIVAEKMESKKAETASEDVLAMTISLTKTDETCPNNGTINATVSGEEAGANVIFEYWNNAAPGNVITSTMPLQGLGDGTYTVKAIATGVNVEEVQSEITIISTYVPIQAYSTVVGVACDGDSNGQATINISAGSNGNRYVIISGPATYLAHPLPYEQVTNVFTNLTEGTYQIRVYDSCGLYNTITVNVGVLPSYLSSYAMMTLPTCDIANVSYNFSCIGDNSVKFPITIETEIFDSANVLLGSQTTVFTGTTTPGLTLSLNHNVPLNITNFDFPVIIRAKITDACGDLRAGYWTKDDELSLKGLCAPQAGFKWDITAFNRPRSFDRNPLMVYPLTISWVNTSNPADTGSTVTTGAPWTGTITGLTPSQEYNVIITDACGRQQTGLVTSTGSGIGQEAFVEVYPACNTGYWVPNFGTANIPGNTRIDTITVLEAPAGSTMGVGFTLAGDNNLWAFTAGQIIEGHYVFSIKMGCDTDIITVDAIGGGIRLVEAQLSPTLNTCNASNVNIVYSWMQGGVDIPVPSIYSPGGFSFALKDVTLPASAPYSFNFQSSTTFTNVPNGTYDVYMFVNRTTSTQCMLNLGEFTISNVGPQIDSPYGFVCQTGNPATPFGVIVNATGVGTLEYAITAFNGTPIAPVWQTTNQFNSLGQGVYTIEIKDNCATTSTVFSTYTIRQPRITPNNLCPGGNGSLIVTYVPGYVYQWFKDGVALTNGGHISGADTNELIFTPFTSPADEGDYSVHVTYQTCVDDIYEIEISGVIPNAGNDVTASACYTNPVIGLDLDTFLSSAAMQNGEWTQTSSNGGTLVDNVFDPNGIDPATGPFIFKYTVNGYCGAFDEATISISFNETVAPSGNATQQFCTAELPTVADLVATGSTIQWYSSTTSLTPITATTALVSGTTYYATQTLAGCESFDRLAVTVTLVAPPVQPIGNSTQEFCNQAGATIADLVATGTGVVWYSTASITTSLPSTTVLEDGVTYYAGSIANGCESATRLAVTVNLTEVAVPTTTNVSQAFCINVNPTIANIATNETGVQWFATATSTTALASTTALVNGATYYGAITTNGCESATRLAVTITITQTPAPTTTSVTQTFCEIDNATVANIVTNETGVQWFATATSTTALASTTALVNGTTYYGAITTNGCESAIRLAVTIFITTSVAPTTTALTQSFCEVELATVSDLVISGNGIQWYADATSTMPLPSTTILTDGTYYATQTTASCESKVRLAIIVNITETVAPSGNATQTFCEISLPTVANLQASGTGIQWFATASSTTPLASTEALVNGATYYATQTLNGCESLLRLQVAVIITATPAPTGILPQAFCQSDNATIANLLVTGTSVQWYATATSTTALALSTVLVNGATYYASQTLNGCESIVRLPITVSIDATPTAIAGADQAQYNTGTFTLAGNNPTIGTGTWTVVSGTATITNPLAYNTTVIILDNSTATLAWTVVNGTCTVSDQVTISYYIPKLEILKSGVFVDTNGDGIDNVGDQIQYSFTVNNTGQITINNIIVTDPLVTVTGGPISLTAGSSDSTTFTAIYNVTQADIDAGAVYNLATVNGQDPNGGNVTDTSVDPNPLSPSDPLFDPACPDCTVVPMLQEPSMTLMKEGVWQDTDGNGMATVGDNIVYTFIVTNTGNVTMSNIAITDPLPGIILSGGPIATLAPGVSDNTTITGLYAVTQADIEAGAVYNLATATGVDTNANPIPELSLDPTPIDVTDPLFNPACPDCTVVPLPQTPQIAIIKTGVFNDDNDDNIAQVGETITYSFEVVNTGNMTLNNIMVSDPLPGVILTGGPIVQLLPGESDTTTFTATYIVTLQDLINGGVTNQALVEATTNTGTIISDISDDDHLDENDPTFVPLEGCTLNVFNAITPNDDGMNDTFYISGIECYPKNKVEIFNRWGVKVYGIDGYNNNDKVFRGFSEGRTTVSQSSGLPTGTYFYVIEFVDFTGKAINKSGYLYIN